MQDVFRAIGRLSQSNVTVLITGESGSGKELVARRAARHSPRGDRQRPVRRDQHRGDPEGPARVASCSATSAARSPARRRCGAAASSRPTAARCSSTRSATCRSTCRRACCACSRRPVLSRRRPQADQEQRARDRGDAPEPRGARAGQGAFREDLFHRLNVIRLRLPALRERNEDIPPLARFFLQKSAKRARRRAQAPHRRGARAA